MAWLNFERSKSPEKCQPSIKWQTWKSVFSVEFRQHLDSAQNVGDKAAAAMDGAQAQVKRGADVKEKSPVESLAWLADGRGSGAVCWRWSRGPVEDKKVRKGRGWAMQGYLHPMRRERGWNVSITRRQLIGCELRQEWQWDNEGTGSMEKRTFWLWEGLRWANGRRGEGQSSLRSPQSGDVAGVRDHQGLHTGYWSQTAGAY